MYVCIVSGGGVPGRWWWYQRVNVCRPLLRSRNRKSSLGSAHVWRPGRTSRWNEPRWMRRSSLLSFSGGFICWVQIARLFPSLSLYRFPWSMTFPAIPGCCSGIFPPHWLVERSWSRRARHSFLRIYHHHRPVRTSHQQADTTTWVQRNPMSLTGTAPPPRRAPMVSGHFFALYTLCTGVHTEAFPQCLYPISLTWLGLTRAEFTELPRQSSRAEFEPRTSGLRSTLATTRPLDCYSWNTDPLPDC